MLAGFGCELGKGEMTLSCKVKRVHGAKNVGDRFPNQ